MRYSKPPGHIEGPLDCGVAMAPGPSTVWPRRVHPTIGTSQPTQVSGLAAAARPARICPISWYASPWVQRQFVAILSVCPYGRVGPTEPQPTTSLLTGTVEHRSARTSMEADRDAVVALSLRRREIMISTPLDWTNFDEPIQPKRHVNPGILTTHDPVLIWPARSRLACWAGATSFTGSSAD
jgi:hypothetical protein